MFFVVRSQCLESSVHFAFTVHPVAGEGCSIGQHCSTGPVYESWSEARMWLQNWPEHDGNEQ